MKIKIGNQSFDSELIPIAVVFSAKEKKQIYEAAQRSLIIRRNEPMFFLSAPKDISPRVAITWAMENISEIKVDPNFIFDLRGIK